MWPIVLLVFVSCFALVYLLGALLLGPRLTVADRLSYYTAQARGRPPAPRHESDRSPADELMERFSVTRSLEHLLEAADVPVKPSEFLLLLALSMIGLGGGVGLLASRGAGTASLLMPAAGLFGLLGPLVWLRLRRSRRRVALNRQLPDALQSISGSLRAGYGFTQGMTAVANDLPAPISLEFARALREMNLGSTVEDVLKGMARRVQSPDFDLAVAGILINRQVGGNLAELLDQLTATIRERVELKNFIRVRTAQQRLSAIIIAGVPPVLILIFLAGLPDYMAYLLTTRIGLALLAVSVFMQLLGAYFIRRIVAIDV